jgi:hypothetical protein
MHVKRRTNAWKRTSQLEIVEKSPLHPHGIVRWKRRTSAVPLHTSAYVSIRQRKRSFTRTAQYAGREGLLRSLCIRIRQHTSAYVRESAASPARHSTLEEKDFCTLAEKDFCGPSPLPTPMLLTFTTHIYYSYLLLIFTAHIYYSYLLLLLLTANVHMAYTAFNTKKKAYIGYMCWWWRCRCWRRSEIL